MESISGRRKLRRYSLSLMAAYCSIYLKIIILIANESAWSLAESISKGNATSVRSPGPGLNNKHFKAKEPVGFRKIQFSNDTFQVVQFSAAGAALIEDFTACAWLKIENTTSNLTLFSYHPHDSVNPDGALRWWISNGGTSIKFWLKDKLVMKRGIKLGDGKWRHICQDWRGSSGHWALHISGLKSLSGNADLQGKNWTLPGIGHVQISSENGGEVYGFTFARKVNASEKSKRGARHIYKETNDTKEAKTSLAEVRPESAESSSDGEEKPEMLNATAEALFWNRGSSRQVETRGSSIGRVAAFLTRVIAFAIIPAMAIINEMRKNRAKNNEVKNIDSNDDDFNFKISDPTTTKAPEKTTTPFNFDNFENSFPSNAGDVNSVGNVHNNGGNPDSIDPFFAQDDDFFRSAENKQVQTKSNQTRASRSYSSQCQSSRLVQHSNATNSSDLVLAASHCCWSDPPPASVVVSWFHTPVDYVQGAKLVNVSKSTCGTF